MRETCTGTKKNTSFELQSSPNLHRDKKNKSFELQSAPNLHRDKKNKKNKNFPIYLESGRYPSKVFVFFVFFVPVQVWCTLKFKTFVFFVPVQVWCTLKFKTCVFFVPVQVWCGSSLAAFLFDMCLRNRQMNFLLQLAKPKAPNVAHLQA